MKAVTLETIADGVAQELFKRELVKVSENIADINTRSGAKRTITMTFTFQPDEERDEVKIIVGAKSNVAPVKPYAKTAYLGTNDGKPAMYHSDQKQMEFNTEGVTPLGGAVANA